MNRLDLRRKLEKRFLSYPLFQSPFARRLVWPVTLLAVLYLLLLIPTPDPALPTPANRKPFVWNKDQYWSSLESGYVGARDQGCDKLKQAIALQLSQCTRLLDDLKHRQRSAEDAIFFTLERDVFTLGPMIAACPEFLSDYINAVVSVRSAVKDQSLHWDMNALPVRDRLYRLLYGCRAALEEVMLQVSPSVVPPTMRCTEEPSSTPSADILGVTIHSGDILVSRGGAATSALIARGNDYPGNFSHVALVHIDSAGNVLLIESHIEKGVAVASIDEYLRDTKLRVMVLRLRSDLPQLAADPMLPAKAASRALRSAQARHIAYDFAMDFHDSSRFFCSEVVSDAYRKAGIMLWKGLSSISTSGVAAWLSAFGVEHLETLEPSDLEYDPQLRVVAEWRDPDVLFRDHVDNAVTDVMLEGAEKGEKLGYDLYLLPMARILKGYSVILNLFGMVGPVPEGMSAVAALRNRRFTSRHATIKAEVLKRAQKFRIERGYVPPYWDLLKLARESKTDLHL